LLRRDGREWRDPTVCYPSKAHASAASGNK
jgi:hypothetical protein